MSGETAFPLGTVARMVCAPAERLECGRRVLRTAVDVVLRPELARETLLVGASAHGGGAETHLRRELDAEVAEAADAEHGNQIARQRAGVAQGVERGDAGAEQRRCLGRVEIVRHGGERVRRAGHGLGIAAVIGDTGVRRFRQPKM